MQVQQIERWTDVEARQRHRAIFVIMIDEAANATDIACDLAEAWLRTLPSWKRHPMSPDRGVSGNHGPALLSEADCVMHFSRFLHQGGVPWEDMHLELSRVRSLFAATHPTFVEGHNWRVDLAVVSNDALAKAALPLADESFRFDAFYEFALASSFWLHGKRFGHPKKLLDKVAIDVQKIGRYVDLGLCRRGYVIVYEECDHGFTDYDDHAAQLHPNVSVRILRGWK